MTKLLAVLGALVLLFAGCADDDDTAQETDETTTTTSADSEDITADTSEGDGAGTPLTATLAGGEGSDPDGSGTATVTLNAPKGEVCFEVTVSNIDTPTAMHIHEGAEGVAGPIVIPLVQPSSGDGTVDDCVDVEKSLIEQVAADPGGHYVNVHTGPFPDGAVRGQLGDAASAGTDTTGTDSRGGGTGGGSMGY